MHAMVNPIWANLYYHYWGKGGGRGLSGDGVKWIRMSISARIANKQREHEVILNTDGREHSLTIPPKPDGLGSSANGGELLFLDLATCYCNDIYLEARKRGIEVGSVQVEVSGEFGGPGDPARNIRYRATVAAKAAQEEILALMRYTDSVAEIQNTLRAIPWNCTDSV